MIAEVIVDIAASETDRIFDYVCPDGLCVGQGKISLTGERITCLPNRVMVEIVGDGEEIFESK